MGRLSGHDQELLNRALAKRYLDWMREARGARPSTCYQYGVRLENFCDFVGTRRLDGVGLADIESWVTRPRRRAAAKGATKAATRATDVAVVRSFYRYLVGHGRVALTDDPTALLQAPTVHNRQPKAPSDETWLAVWDSDLDPAERVMLGMGYYLGLRRHEMCFLRPMNVALSRGQLVGFVRKGGSEDVLPYRSCLQVIAQHPKTRHLLLDPDAFLAPFEALVRARGSAGEAYVLPWAPESCAQWTDRGGLPKGATNPDRINKRLAAIVRRLGVDWFSPHALRHGFCTNLLRADVPIHVVSRLANHSSIDVTMRYVKTAVDPLAEYLVEDAGRLAPPARW